MWVLALHWLIALSEALETLVSTRLPSPWPIYPLDILNGGPSCHLGEHRRVVAHTFASLHPYGRLLVRYERRAHPPLPFLPLSVAPVAFTLRQKVLGRI